METYKTTTVEQLTTLLTDAVQVLKNKKQTASDFHKFVQEIVTPLLKPLGMTYTTWGIAVEGQYKGEYVWDKILELNLERVDDKRAKYKTAWKNTILAFTPVLDITPDASIEELITRIQLDHLEKNVKKVEEYITELTDSLALTKANLAEYQQKIDCLKNELNDYIA